MTRSDELPEPPENDDPFMARLACDLQAFVFAERGDAAEVMTLRRACFEAWRFEDTDQQIYLGLDLFDDLMVLDRIEEAAQLLSQLDAMIAYVGYPEMQASSSIARLTWPASSTTTRGPRPLRGGPLDGIMRGNMSALALDRTHQHAASAREPPARARAFLEIPHRSGTP